MTGLIELLAQARQAKLDIEQKDDRLVIRGPREHERLVRALLDRKPEVLSVLAVYNGEVSRLDWRREPILSQAAPCALCGRSTFLIEPYDRRACHKTCAEAAIRWGSSCGVVPDAGRAA
ncbi:MAG TPA: hypothetical protein VFB06_29555 [Streptosporangiaceae bacterium]|nr:hypothetical protein [Streptosporangiaceae bacterium]